MRLISICLLLMNFVGCVTQSSLKASNSLAQCSVTAEMQVCETDDDCALVQNGCCSCLESGQQTAIAKQHQKAYENQCRSACDMILCAQVLSQHESCQASGVRCYHGMCQLTF